MTRRKARAPEAILADLRGLRGRLDKVPDLEKRQRELFIEADAAGLRPYEVHNAVPGVNAEHMRQVVKAHKDGKR